MYMFSFNEREYINKLGLRIRSIRKGQKMTQLDLSTKAGMEENAIQRIESGRTNPTFKTLLKIIAAFNIPIKDFFSEGFE